MTKRALESSYESTDSPCPRTFDRAPIRTALADDDVAEDFGNDRGSAQIPTQPRSHGLFHAFTQSLIPNESSEHVIVTLYTITSITSIYKYLLKGFSLFYNAEQLNITP